MKRKTVTILLALALLICIVPQARKAKAGQYDYILTFDGNGGRVDSTTGPTTKKVTLSQSYYVAGPEAVKHTAYKTGYKFLGWYDNKGNKLDKNYYGAPGTVYARWEKLKYKVYYYGNGGSGVPGTQTKNYGENLTLSSTRPTRTGYSFQGWGKSASTTTVSYSPGGTYTGNAELKLYAIWKINTYSVTYHANGGSGAPAGQTKTYGQNLTLSTTKPTRTGYTFKGWGLGAGTTAVAYNPGSVYTENKALDLYAIWEIEQYDVVYNANGGSGAPAAQKKTYGQDLTLSDKKPVREGYDFQGWAKSANGEAVYGASGIYKDNSAVTLYAVWKKKVFSITIYTSTGGSNGSSYTVKKEYGEKYTITSTSAPTGYYLEGYGIPGDTTTAKYHVGDVYTVTGHLTLYPVFAKYKYTVKYNANGGTGAPSAQTKEYGETLVLSNVKPTRDGYDFAGWGTSANSGTVVYYSGKNYTANESVTLYAVWREKTYTIYICTDAGANGSFYTISKKHGVPVNLPSTSAATGYYFVGYSTSANAVTAEYPVGAQYVKNESATLYPVFKKYEISADRTFVTFNAKGCAESEATRINLSSTYNGTYSLTKRSQSGNADWLHARIENNKTVVLYVDPNLDGDTIRSAGLVITNGCGVECTIGVQQSGNFIRLVDGDGVVEWNPSGPELVFDEQGYYKGRDSVAAMHVNTEIDAFTYSINYDNGTSAFLTVTKDGKNLTISCAPNSGADRSAELVIVSGNVTKSYRIAQEAIDVSVTYLYFSHSGLVQQSVVQKCGTVFDSGRRGAAETVAVDGTEVILDFVGWKTLDTYKLIPNGAKIYKDTVCIATYAKIGIPFGVIRTVAGKPVADDSIVTCTWQGDALIKTESSAGLVMEMKAPAQQVIYYEYPAVTASGGAVLSENCDFISLKAVDTYLMIAKEVEGPAFVGEYERVTNAAKVWVFDLTVDEYSYVTVEDSEGTEVAIPYTQDRCAPVIFQAANGLTKHVTFIQRKPEVVNRGWNRALSMYGIHENEYYDPLLPYFVSTTEPGVAILLYHSMLREDDHLVNQTDFRIRYVGGKSIVASHSKGANYREEYFIRPEDVSEAYDWLQDAYDYAVNNKQELGLSDKFGPLKDITDKVIELVHETEEGVKDVDVIDFLFKFADCVDKVANWDSNADAKLITALKESFVPVYNPQNVADYQFDNVADGIHIKYHHDFGVLSGDKVVVDVREAYTTREWFSIDFDRNTFVVVQELPEDLWSSPFVKDTFTIE